MSFEVNEANPALGNDTKSRLLSSKEQFKSAVSLPNGAKTTWLILLTVAALLLARNIISTIQAMSQYGYGAGDFFAVFFSTDADSAGGDVILMLYVWGPIVLALISGIFLVLDFLYIGPKRLEENYEQFRTRGFVGDLIQLPLEVKKGSDRYLGYAIAGPQADPAQTKSWAERTAHDIDENPKQYKKLGKELLKATSAAMGGQRNDRTVVASQYFPGAPQGVLLKLDKQAEVSQNPQMALLPLDDGTFKALRIKASKLVTQPDAAQAASPMFQ